MQEQVYQTPIYDVNDFKQRLLDTCMWAAVYKRIIYYYFVNEKFGIERSNTHIFLSTELNVTVCWNHILV